MWRRCLSDCGACRGRRGGLIDWSADRLHRNGRAREFDAGRLKGAKQPLHRFALDHGRDIRLYRELEAHHEGVVENVRNALELQRLQEFVLELRLLHHREADLFHSLTQFLYVRVAGKAQIEFHRRPIPAEIGDLAKLTEGDRDRLGHSDGAA